MVIGRTSNFVEGFKSFTADDELMLANLKQALNYSSENLSIPDAKLNLPSKQPTKELNTIRPRNTMSITTPNITESNITLPNMTESNMTESTMPKPTSKYSMSNKSEEFKNIKKVSSGSQNSTKVYDDESDNEEEDEHNADNEDAVMDEEEYSNTFEEEAEGKAERDRSMTRRQHQAKEQIEGFQGSVEIEGRNLKNVLLALLLSFIGYLVVYASINNYIPINDISPQLKKFKNLVYGGIFFVIAYICLEVF